MSRRAFFIAGDRVIHIANPCGAGLSYHAQAHVVRPGVQVGPQMQEQAETVIVVESGVIEVMINGMSAYIPAGDFVRVPPGAWFAYRNDAETPALVLQRTAPVQRARHGRTITVRIAAA